MMNGESTNHVAVSLGLLIAGLSWCTDCSGQQLFTEASGRAIPLVPAEANRLELVDLDSDGDLDLLVADQTSPGISVLENDGFGRFLDVTETRLGIDQVLGATFGIGDVDGDGDPDVVVVSRSLPQQTLLLNDGNGTLSEAPGTPLPFVKRQYREVVVFDADGDLDLDLFLAGRNQDRLLFNDGSGVFTDETALRLPVENEDARRAVAADLDGDGDLDLALAIDDRSISPSYPRIPIYLNDGTGSFSIAPSNQVPSLSGFVHDVEAFDVDGDGDTDLALASIPRGVDILENDGQGSFTFSTSPPPIGGNREIECLTALDVENDGDLDLVGGRIQIQGSAQLFVNDGNGNFALDETGRLPIDNQSTEDIISGDVDGNGSSDLVLGHFNFRDQSLGTKDLYLNDGSGHFRSVTAKRLLQERRFSRAAASADFDSDGFADLYVVNSLQPDQLLLNDGFGNFIEAAPSRLPPTDQNGSAVIAEDFDLDGNIDLFIATLVGPSRLYLNDGTATFTDASDRVAPNSNLRTGFAQTADLDLDGDLDIVLAGSRITNSPEDRILLNDGTGFFTLAPMSSLPSIASSTVGLAVGDFDGDLDADIIVAKNRGIEIRLYLNDGNAVFSDSGTDLFPLIGGGSFSSNACVGGDTDGDGDLDLIVGVFGRDEYLLNNGDGTFENVSTTLLQSSLLTTFSTDLVDIDLDGDLDLLRTFNPGPFRTSISVALNDGSGAFSEFGIEASRSFDAPPTALFASDLDGDRDPDLVFLNNEQNRMLLNRTVQLDAPFELRSGASFRFEFSARSGPQSLSDLVFAYLALESTRVDVGTLGTLQLAGSTAPIAPILLPRPQSDGSIIFDVPAGAALVGAELFAQALVVSFPIGGRLTNAIRAVVID
ncbi:MAG: VCBS repeat-containing protein [Planctomycetota bacterium]